LKIRLIYDKSLEHILFALVRPQTLKELKERDIELSLLDGDVILVLQDNRNVILNEEILSWGKPIILWERNASTKVEFVEAVNDPRVVMYIKGQAALKNRDLYDTLFQKDKYHYKLFWDVASKKERKHMRLPAHSSVLIPEAKKKIVVFYNDGLWQRAYPYSRLKVDFGAKRKTDVWFVGKVDRQEQYAYTFHRRAAVRRMEKLERKIKTHISTSKIKQPEYQKSLLTAKIVVSPWGFGEVCWRDFEAVMSGCVLIKPCMDFVETWPDIFVPGQTYFPCKPDFSDLKVVVDYILSSWKQLKGLRRHVRKIVIDSWKPDVIAQRFQSIVEKISIR